MVPVVGTRCWHLLLALVIGPLLAPVVGTSCWHLLLAPVVGTCCWHASMVPLLAPLLTRLFASLITLSGSALARPRASPLGRPQASISSFRALATSAPKRWCGGSCPAAHSRFHRRRDFLRHRVHSLFFHSHGRLQRILNARVLGCRSTTRLVSGSALLCTYYRIALKHRHRNIATP